MFKNNGATSFKKEFTHLNEVRFVLIVFFFQICNLTLFNSFCNLMKKKFDRQLLIYCNEEKAKDSF